MPVVLKLLPDVTITNVGGGASDFTLAGLIAPSTNSATFTQSVFTVYGAVFNNPSATPTAEVIELGTGAISTDSGDALASLTFTGLSSNVQYDSYFVGKDALDEYTAVLKITFTTTDDGSPPVDFNLGFGFDSEENSIMLGLI